MSRILLLAPELHGIGGVERLVAGLSRLLAVTHEVHVASFDAPGTVPGVPLSVPYHALGGGAARPLPLRALTYAGQVRRLRAIERRLRIDVTISNLWRADLISALAGRDVRRVALAHINVVGNPTNRLMLRLRPIVAAAYRRLDRVVGVSAALAAELARLYRLRPERVSAIPNFVSVPPGLAYAPKQAGRLVWCGRMVPEKSLPALVGIVARLAAAGRAISLDVVGDGPDRAAAERAAAAQPGAIRFHGMLADPLPLIAQAAALALPSHSEGLPMVLLEALALGTPVVAADAGGGGVHHALGARTPHDPERMAGEAVPAGLLLPIPRDDARCGVWAGALDDLLTDRARLERMGAAARQLAAAHTPEAVGARWNGLIAELVA
ncbi:glycosyltransferase family 4 protein [Sphingomonas jatrophae]|uniref:Glycosyltransferase involved in cell wall bisynthesis n=1 Tax=Sphingomonas jatrophae TaxID=1166337 RepID=A0A1I6L630_9SPHN|nr:glycosyltransferase family 4 protein [Sphingomonas jatrophae]SFR98919.1 Glycosyltransferase involved in cell wall bisynthesis [Sphingomonas jatrophae]